MVVKGLLYTPEHEWVKIDGALAIVGITDHAQQMLGEVTFVELPQVGTSFKAGESLAVVESSKAASDIYAPLAGEVVGVNKALESGPELINQSCYQDGWICRMEVADPKSAKGLMDANRYEEYLKSL